MESPQLMGSVGISFPDENFQLMDILHLAQLVGEAVINTNGLKLMLKADNQQIGIKES
jgi:hypothetical protein